MHEQTHENYYKSRSNRNLERDSRTMETYWSYKLLKNNTSSLSSDHHHHQKMPTITLGEKKKNKKLAKIKSIPKTLIDSGPATKTKMKNMLMKARDGYVDMMIMLSTSSMFCDSNENNEFVFSNKYRYAADYDL